MIKNDFSLEPFIDGVCNSKRIVSRLTCVLIAGAALCFILLVPYVQDTLVDLIEVNIHRKVNDFQERLFSIFTLPLIGLAVCVIALCCIKAKSIAEFLTNKANDKIIIRVCAVCRLLLLVFTTVFCYKFCHGWLNSDHSSEMALAKLLADENSLVSTNWYYSTELRLVYQTIFMAPLFRILGDGNWELVRSLTVFFNILALTASYVFMTAKMRMSRKYIAISSVMLILPVSGGYWDIVLFGGFYILFIAQVFATLGLFFMLIDNGENRHTKTSGLIALCAFSFLTLVLGVQGVRSLMAFGIPLLFTGIYLEAGGTARGRKTPLFLSVYGFVLCGAGFVINYLLHFKYRFSSFDDMRFDNLYSNLLQKISQGVFSIVEFFGLAQGQIVFSAAGILGVAAIIFTVVLFAFSLKTLRGNSVHNTESKELSRKTMSAFFIASVVFNLFLLVVVNDNVTARYFIPSLILYLPVVCMLFEHCEKHKSSLRFVFVISSVIFFVAAQGYLNYLNLSRTDSNKTRRGYIEYCLKNNIDFGFANFWNANVTTELTNGKIEIAGLEPDYLEDNKFKVQLMLNKKDYIEGHFPAGRAFILLSRDEWNLAKLQGRAFAQRLPDYEDDNYCLLVWPSADEIYDTVLYK